MARSRPSSFRGYGSMARKHMVDSKFWSDPWVVDHLDPLSSYVYFYLFTNEHANVAGVYEISLRTIAYETKIEKDEIERMLKRFEPKARYVDGWVILRSGIKNQNYHSPKMKVAIDNVLKTVPQELIQYIKWPDDYGTQKPKGSAQTSLLDHESQLNVARVELNTTPATTEEAYGMHRVSHSNSNSNGPGGPSNSVPLAKAIGATKVAMDDQPKKIPSREINEMLTYWKNAVGYEIASKMKSNRYACSNLLKKHGKQKLRRIVDGVAMAKQDKFAPRIADFCDLQSKMNELLSWGHMQASAKRTDVVS